MNEARSLRERLTKTRVKAALRGKHDAMTDAARFNREELFKEAEVFHQAVFGRPVPGDIREEFVSANKILLKDAIRVTPVRINLILERSLDVEAIEFALRRKDPQNLLTRKLLILCYLTESRSAYFRTFVNDRYRPVTGFIKLSFAVFRSVYKLVKGHCLIRLYGIV